MTHVFTRSSRVIRQLAQDAARTPPADEDLPFDYIDKSLTILGRTFDIQNQQMHRESIREREFMANEFRGLDRRLIELEKKVDERFQEFERKVDGRFQKFEKMVDGQFQKFEKRVNERFQELGNKMDRRFEEVDGKLRRQLEHLQKSSRNALRTRGWEHIYPVGPFDAQGGLRIPQNFPRTVKVFWKLKMPSRLGKLIDLIRFYNIQGYEEWGTDTESHEWGDTDSDDDTQSSKSSKLLGSVEIAVRLNPDFAHRALAVHLGLVYDEIEKFMERAQTMREARSREVKKRGQDAEPTGRKRWPFKIPSEEEGTDVTSPTNVVGSSQEMAG